MHGNDEKHRSAAGNGGAKRKTDVRAIARLVLAVAVAAMTLLAAPYIAARIPADKLLMLARLDADEARQLKETGQIMSLETLIARVRKEYPGQIIEIELDEKHDRFIYEIEVVNEEGVVIKLDLDAATGEVLKYKKDY